MSDDPISVDELMSLAPEYGRVPENLRNRGYDKLGFAPGEGGVSAGPPRSESPADLDTFLAAVEAGADPAKLAEKMRAATSTGRRRGGAR